jgi:hypothetical protein
MNVKRNVRYCNALDGPAADRTRNDWVIIWSLPAGQAPPLIAKAIEGRAERRGHGIGSVCG